MSRPEINPAFKPNFPKLVDTSKMMEAFNFRHQILTLGYKQETHTLQFIARVFVINPRLLHQYFEHFITT